MKSDSPRASRPKVSTAAATAAAVAARRGTPALPPLGHAAWRYDDAGRVLIDRPDDTERCGRFPIHMIANGSDYFLVCDALLRGFSGRDATRMLGEFDGPSFPKQQGRAVWLREKGRLVSATYAPALGTSPRALSSTYDLGEVALHWEDDGLAVETAVFVPVGQSAECWQVTVTNRTSRSRTLDVALVLPIFAGSRSYVEYHRDVVRLYNKPRIRGGALYLENGLEWIEGKTGRSPVTYVAASSTHGNRKPDRAWSDREDFLGPWARWDRPEALEADREPRITGLGRELVYAAQFRAVTLAPGQERVFALAAGVALSPAEARSIAALAAPAPVARARRAVTAFWKSQVEQLSMTTGSPALDHGWNRWWLHQSLIRHWFGNTGHPQFDYGTDFSGWREIWQDLLATAPLAPEECRRHALYTLEGIRPDGTNATRFFTRTRKFGSDEVNGLWCDHPYWTVGTMRTIADELGDLSIFTADGIPWFRDAFRSRGDRKDRDWEPGTIGLAPTADTRPFRGSSLEHLLAQNLGMYYDCGPRGLLKHRRTDWNDAIDQLHGGENAVFTFGLARNLRLLAGILDDLSRRAAVSEVPLFAALARLVTPGANDGNAATRIARMKEFCESVDGVLDPNRVSIPIETLRRDLLEKADAAAAIAKRRAYNGEYFHGYFRADGRAIEAVGESSIHLMPQTWAIYGDAVDDRELDTLVASVFARLWDRRGGLRLNAPPYTAFDPEIGRVSGFAPGTKENNAVFNHANLYFMHALLTRRRAEDAWRVFRGIALDRPHAAGAGPHLPEYWISSDHPHLGGRAEYPLLTGTGPWTRYVVPRYFLGVRGVLDGLAVDPCLPDDPAFRSPTLSLGFRGERYTIRIHNPVGVSGGRVVAARVDGREIAPADGRLIIPTAASGRTPRRAAKSKTRTVEVWLG